MKTKAFFFIVGLTILSFGNLFSQNRDDNENIKTKVAQAVNKLDDAFKFEKLKCNTVEEIFTEFYQQQEKLKNNIQRPASGLAQGLSGQDFQSVRKRNEALITERDKRLMLELTEDQYKKWKGQIEPALHKRGN